MKLKKFYQQQEKLFKSKHFFAILIQFLMMRIRFFLREKMISFATHKLKLLKFEEHLERKGVFKGSSYFPLFKKRSENQEKKIQKKKKEIQYKFCIGDLFQQKVIQKCQLFGDIFDI